MYEQIDTYTKKETNRKTFLQVQNSMTLAQWLPCGVQNSAAKEERRSVRVRARNKVRDRDSVRV